jgi:hypothetical protein
VSGLVENARGEDVEATVKNWAMIGLLVWCAWAAAANAAQPGAATCDR